MKKYVIKFRTEIDITEVVDFCIYVVSVLITIMENVKPSPVKKQAKKRVEKTVTDANNVDLNDYQTINDNRVGEVKTEVKEGFKVNHNTGTLDYITYIESDTEKCLSCNTMIVGKRKGAKFCSDYCKNAYHNKNN